LNFIVVAVFIILNQEGFFNAILPAALGGG
jgi:hypothetical protein